MHTRSGFNGGGRAAELLSPAVIVLALVALLLVPVVIQREVAEIRAEIQDAADPARTAVTNIQYLLARQTSSLRGFFISRDSSYLESYRSFAVREREAQDRLSTLVRRLGNDPLAHSVELRALSERWHMELELDLREGAGVGPGEIPFESGLYLEALGAASRLDEALARATRERRDAIEAAERRARWLQVGLGVLALAAALSTAWLSRRVQRLAAEAEARRHEAERALAETARAVESKARLIRGVTHDVKNPLGAADGYAELLEMGLKGDLTPSQVKVVAGIRRSIHGALEIIQDLLDLSRAEAGDLPVEHRPVRLDRLVEEVVEEYRGSAAASGHTLQLALSPDRPIALTDGARVRQILGNLLANAIKYTPGTGHIGVAVGLEPNGAGPRPGRWVCVRVSDTGPGIRPEDRDRIFEEFQRLAETTVRGHGLGLSISRRLARLLGGDITVESEVGQGSTFVLWLPGEPG